MMENNKLLQPCVSTLPPRAFITELVLSIEISGRFRLFWLDIGTQSQIPFKKLTTKPHRLIRAPPAHSSTPNHPSLRSWSGTWRSESRWKWSTATRTSSSACPSTPTAACWPPAAKTRSCVSLSRAPGPSFRSAGRGPVFWCGHHLREQFSELNYPLKLSGLVIYAVSIRNNKGDMFHLSWTSYLLTTWFQNCIVVNF